MGVNVIMVEYPDYGLYTREVENSDFTIHDPNKCMLHSTPAKKSNFKFMVNYVFREPP